MYENFRELRSGAARSSHNTSRSCRIELFLLHSALCRHDDDDDEDEFASSFM